MSNTPPPEPIGVVMAAFTCASCQKMFLVECDIAPMVEWCPFCGFHPQPTRTDSAPAKGQKEPIQ